MEEKLRLYAPYLIECFISGRNYQLPYNDEYKICAYRYVIVPVEQFELMIPKIRDFIARHEIDQVSEVK